MDWKLIITELVASGSTQVQIAAVCGCSQATISELLRGLIKQPSYPIGEALLSMHKKHSRKKATA